MIQSHLIRAAFPILSQKVNGKPLVYLDNAATSQKPASVIKAINDYYEQYNSNIHRGAHHLAHLATEAYEQAREKIAAHINAQANEVNFVRGTTEGINLVAQAYGRKFFRKGDEIIVSEMEHHSNIVPWQMLCEQTGAVLKTIPINQKGEIVFEAYKALLSERTKLVSIAWISNAFGTIHPVKDIIFAAHVVGAKVMLDCAQALPHLKVDVKEVNCDFLAFSGHKMYGPTGIGILYGKEELLDEMDPYMGGGEMIETVSFSGTTYNQLPYKFEAGTPHIEGGIALGTAVDFINEIGINNIASHENDLLQYATSKLQEINELTIYGTATDKASVVSFLIEGIQTKHRGILLNEQGVAIRTGHHCCQPLMQRFGIEGTCRASFAVYNTREEVDVLVAGVKRAMMVLG